MKFGNFSNLADNYAKTRPGYSLEFLSFIFPPLIPSQTTFADFGAGTGIFSRQIRDYGVEKVFAIEPNLEMRNQGISNSENKEIFWVDGSAENTNLENASVDVLSMASSFHWTNTGRALKEFSRVVKPGGKFIAVWNPRKIHQPGLEYEVSLILKEFLPGYVRKSSGYSPFCDNLAKTLIDSDLFSSVKYSEADSERTIASSDYIKLWQSVNDIQVELGEVQFAKFLEKVSKLMEGELMVTVSNVTRSWVATFKD
jgi:ubiquinone/menaquinone biosynthesis C-methylase UbiE